jgi:hypothetical protein
MEGQILNWESEASIYNGRSPDTCIELGIRGQQI